MVSEALNIVNRHGLSLSGVLEKNQPESKSVVILCHGLNSNKEASVVSVLYHHLTCNTYRFDFTGNGESEGVWAYGAYKREADDIDDVVKYFISIGWEVSTVIGHSKGAAVTLLYGMDHSVVPHLISIASRFDHSKTPASRFTKKEQNDLKTMGYTLKPGPNGRVQKITQAGIDERNGVNFQ
eukprot:Ihof_evm7s129 gene=Ihof_evmTU7s129